MLHRWVRAAEIALAWLTVLAAPGAAPGPSPAGGHPAPQPSAGVAALLQQAGQAEKSADRLRLYDAALATARSLSDQVGEARALLWIGSIYESTGEPRKALDFYSQALPLKRAVGDRGGEATTLTSIGVAYYKIGQPQKAADLYNQALPLMRAAGDRGGEAATLANLGSVYSDLGQPQKALSFYNQALPLMRAAGDKRGEATTLRYIGTVYQQLGQPQKALVSYNQALPLIRAAGDRDGETATLRYIGQVYSDLGQPQQALVFYNQALPLIRAAGDRRAEAITLACVGVVYGETGQPQRALVFYNQALPLMRGVGDRGGEAATLASIGTAYHRLGLPQQALAFYNQALPLIRAVGDKRGEATALSNIGLVYRDLGQPQSALEFYNQALPLNRAVQDKPGEATTLSCIGAAYWQLGQSQQALAFYNQALPLIRAVGDKRGEATTLNNIGAVYNQIGQPQKALAFYHQALSLRRAAGDRAGEAATLSNIGNVYIAGRPQQALGYLNQALTLRRAVGDKNGEAITLANMAVAEESLGQLEPAARHLQGALAILESMRAGLGSLAEAKVSFLASNLDAYQAYIHLLLRQHNAAAAFAWAEKSKARALLDLLAAGNVDPNQGLTPEEQGRVQQLRAQESQLNQQLVAERIQPAPDKERVAALEQQMAQASHELQTFTDQLYALHPGPRSAYARRRLAKTVALPDLAHFLPADTALLDYVGLKFVLAGSRPGTKTHVDETILFCVTLQNGQPLVHTYPLPHSRAELAEKVNDFRQACADPRAEYQFKAQEMYRLLIAPAAAQLAGKKRLLVCPDGPLWSCPFQAFLLHPGPAGAPTFLAQRFEIDYASSATAAQAVLQASRDTHRLRPTGTLLAFADPDFGVPSASGSGSQLLASARPIIADARPIIADARGLFVRGDGRITPLPGTEQEAAALKQAFPDAVIYTGAQAQKATALKEAGRYRYLHFATHGLLNDAAPWMSAVVLAQPPPGSEGDQFLTARDLCDLKLSAELVVLSACDTARGQQQAGEGVVGLSWALFVAGAASQVVSQWSVNDTSTAALMGQFYAGLKAGQEKGAALRAAELSLLKDGQHAHPYYWAPFILLGDWR